MTTTLTLSTNLNISPFELFAQDCDEVIMVINYYLSRANRSDGAKINTNIPHKQNGEMRIRVNDKTATGGWY